MAVEWITHVKFLTLQYGEKIWIINKNLVQRMRGEEMNTRGFSEASQNLVCDPKPRNVATSWDCGSVNWPNGKVMEMQVLEVVLYFIFLQYCAIGFIPCMRATFHFKKSK